MKPTAASSYTLTTVYDSEGMEVEEFVSLHSTYDGAIAKTQEMANFWMCSANYKPEQFSLMTNADPATEDGDHITIPVYIGIWLGMNGYATLQYNIHYLKGG